MKLTLIFLTAMMSLNTVAQKASTEFNKKNQTTTVSTLIDAPAEKIWQVLTDGEDFARWNSTVVSFEGKIALGEKVRLISTLDDSRTFKLKVKEFQAGSKLVWGDNKGTRTYTLVEEAGSTRFTMSETIGGFMYGMWKKYLPDFDKSFEQFAADLKSESEK